jgi:hypothetical protein
MRERYLLAMTAIPFVVAAFLPGALLGGNEVTRFEDPEIVESSGLAVVDGLLVTTNDSGDSGRVFTVDPATGETVGVTQWSADPVDVEALAPAGGGEVWVGDIGDNRAERTSVSVARVPVGRGTVTSTCRRTSWCSRRGHATPSRCWPTRRPTSCTSSARASSAGRCTPHPGGCGPTAPTG